MSPRLHVALDPIGITFGFGAEQPAEQSLEPTHPFRVNAASYGRDSK